jgi:hypothetical protein
MQTEETAIQVDEREKALDGANRAHLEDDRNNEHRICLNFLRNQGRDERVDKERQMKDK